MRSVLDTLPAQAANVSALSGSDLELCVMC